jgi:hypothetical protein
MSRVPSENVTNVTNICKTVTKRELTKEKLDKG